MTTYVEDPAASAADDAAIERTINALPDAELLDLAAYAHEWDMVNAEGQEEEHTRLALVRPVLPWRLLLPIAIVSIGILYFAWGV